MDGAREAPVDGCWLDGPACVAYRPRILAFYRKLQVDESEQEDLTQTVLTKVLPKERAFPSERARDTYVFKAAANVWKDWTSKSNRTRTVSLDEILAPTEAGSDVPDALHQAAEGFERVLEAETAAQVLAAVEQLPPKMQRCVWLFYYQDRTQQEIAALLRIDVNTVKSHLGQARDLLRKRLGRKFGIIPAA